MTYSHYTQPEMGLGGVAQYTPEELAFLCNISVANGRYQPTTATLPMIHRLRNRGLVQLSYLSSLCVSLTDAGQAALFHGMDRR